MATHLAAFYTATAGSSGANLGSDEEDIVLMQCLIWDIAAAKLISEHQYVIKPSSCLVDEANNKNSNNNNNNNFQLSEQCRAEFGLTEEQVLTEGQSLEEAVEALESVLESVASLSPSSPSSAHLDNVTNNNIVTANNLKNTNHIDDLTSERRVVVVTDGQLHLRQVLHPQAVARGIQLSGFFSAFFDLRKEFKTFFNLSTDVFSIKEMMEYAEIKFDVDSTGLNRATRDMATIIHKMTSQGHRFLVPEFINLRLEPGICTRSEEVDSNCVVRARGLPWQSSDQDIAKFFRGLNIAKGGVALCLSAQGRRNGEALVRFSCPEHRDMALKRHKHHIANRYIEVYRANGEDFINVAGGNNNEAQQFLSRGGQVIIRMRGLPYDCTAKQVADFFASGGDGIGVELLDGECGVLFVRRADGRATGDAFVQFATDEDSDKALAKHRDSIGARYIELFRSTSAEVQQVLNRSMDPKTYEHPPPSLLGALPSATAAAAAVAAVASMPMLPQHYVTAGSRRDCVRLRGLPYEAQVEHVLAFLGEHAKNISVGGVHMVINGQGQPSGEAFIQMQSEAAAAAAAAARHHLYMVSGKKQRYVEVFQCSGDDMNLVVSGGLLASPGGGSAPSQQQPQAPHQRPPPAATALLSPTGGGMLATPFGTFAVPPSPLGAPLQQLGGRAHPVPPGYPPSIAVPPALVYWSYPSPPVSPGAHFYTPHSAAAAATAHLHAAAAAAAAAAANPHHHYLMSGDCIPMSPHGQPTPPDCAPHMSSPNEAVATV